MSPQRSKRGRQPTRTAKPNTALRDFQPEYVSPKEFGIITGFSTSTARWWAYTGRIASVKTGSAKQAKLLIPISEIRRVMAAGFRPAIEQACDSKGDC